MLFGQTDTAGMSDQKECSQKRAGAERQHLLDLTGIAPGEYDPHSRETALAGHEVGAS